MLLTSVSVFLHTLPSHTHITPYTTEIFVLGRNTNNLLQSSLNKLQLNDKFIGKEVHMEAICMQILDYLLLCFICAIVLFHGTNKEESIEFAV